jgi:predicted NBD/HSP70 family sugar kinase
VSSRAVKLGAHGASRLAAVDIDDYNAEISDGEGFVGDRASGSAFREMLDAAREEIRKFDEDPLGELASSDISKKRLDRLLAEGDPEAAGLLLGSIEAFATEFAQVIGRFMRVKAWKGTERIVVGGGLRASRIGELVIGRAAVLLKAQEQPVELVPIRHDPDEAGLIGCVHLAPPWVFSGHDAILAVDIGGSNIRVGVVQLNIKKSADLSKSKVIESALWHHAEDDPDRQGAVERLIAMLKTMIKRADKAKAQLAPFIGIGCPGRIRDDGSIEKGGQNLPGDWEHKSFNLPLLLHDAIPAIDGHETIAVMHNDAVVQGLSEIPFMRDVKSWGVMTIGTGLGNARFTNR